jgi:hypothetical protein
MSNKTKTNFWLDLLIFALFVIVACIGLLLWLVIPGGQGDGQHMALFGLNRRAWISLHTWLGVSMLSGGLIHLLLHWEWITCVAGRFFKKLARPARLNFSLDSLLFAIFALSSLSGLILGFVLPGGGHRGGRNLWADTALLGLTRHDWSTIHLWAGLTIIALLGVHLTLHWAWITCMTHRYVGCGPAKRAEV